MKILTIISLCVLTSFVYSQDSNNQFLDVIVEGKEAFMSTKTGEVIFREHATTNPEAFIVDANGNTFYIDTKIHSVKKGETLSSIAKKHKTSIARIKKDNKLSKVNLSIGQKIKINTTQNVEILKPEISSAGESRIVARLAPGQNPTQLNSPPPGQMPNSTYVKSEKVTNETTQVSETKVIETVEVVENEIQDEVEEQITQEPNKTVDDTSKFYTVKKGDTLFGIAKKFGISIQELKKINELVLNNLSIGQKLKVK